MDHGSREVLERTRRRLDDSKRLNALVCVVLGVVFGGFGAACFAGVVVTLMGSAGAGATVGAGVFGLFWFALAALLLAIGVKGLKRLAQKKRLEATGIRCSARITSYTESAFRVDGATVFTLNLEVSLPNRAPYAVRLKEPVPRSSSVYTDATLSVLVDPAAPNSVVVDWWA